MTFETKYLIRWGIPGWIFILFLFLNYLILNVDSIVKESNTLKIFGYLISAGFIGVPIGYIFNQIYFSLNWINFDKSEKKAVNNVLDLIDRKDLIKIDGRGDNRHHDYYRLEYVWQRELLKLPNDKRIYLSERYRYFLSTIHGLGALRVSLFFSMVFTFGFLIYYLIERKTFSCTHLTLILLILYLFYTVHKGFNYYSDNLAYFRGYFLNEMLNGELMELRDSNNFNKSKD